MVWDSNADDNVPMLIFEEYGVKMRGDIYDNYVHLLVYNGVSDVIFIRQSQAI